MNKNKLQELLKKLETLEGSLPMDETKTYLDDLLENETRKFQDGFKNNPTVKFLDGFNLKLDKFKKDFNLTPIIDEIEKIQSDIEEFKDNHEKQLQVLNQEHEGKFKEYLNLIEKTKNELKTKSSKEIQDVLNKLGILESDFNFQTSASKDSGMTLKQTIKSLSERLDGVFKDLVSRDVKDGEFNTTLQQSLEEHSEGIKNTLEEISKVRKEFIQKLSGLGGGSMNRKITFNGVDYLTKYTDINYKAGTNITFTISNNDTNKMVDVTVSASGTGGGTVRNINVVSVSSVFGEAAATDYVAICNQGVQVTLPTAISNTNLYTVKNVSASSVLVATTGGQTIDSDSNLILRTQYTAVDLISDGSNWNIT